MQVGGQVAKTVTDRVAVPKPTLSVMDAVTLVVGFVVGAGIFETSALVAANAGSASVAVDVQNRLALAEPVLLEIFAIALNQVVSLRVLQKLHKEIKSLLRVISKTFLLNF